MEKQRDEDTDRQIDVEQERQRDRQTERQRDTETKPIILNKYFSQSANCWSNIENDLVNLAKTVIIMK